MKGAHGAGAQAFTSELMNERVNERTNAETCTLGVCVPSLEKEGLTLGRKRFRFGCFPRGVPASPQLPLSSSGKWAEKACAPWAPALPHPGVAVGGSVTVSQSVGILAEPLFGQ